MKVQTLSDAWYRLSRNLATAHGLLLMLTVELPPGDGRDNALAMSDKLCGLGLRASQEAYTFATSVATPLLGAPLTESEVHDASFQAATAGYRADCLRIMGLNAEDFSPTQIDAFFRACSSVPE